GMDPAALTPALHCVQPNLQLPRQVRQTPLMQGQLRLVGLVMVTEGTQAETPQQGIDVGRIEGCPVARWAEPFLVELLGDPCTGPSCFAQFYDAITQCSVLAQLL